MIKNMASEIEHVLIAGGGVVGISTAYFLAKQHNVSKITLIEPTGKIAPAASGKAAGFLALDWRDGTPLESVARRSFQLHQQLAETLGAEKIQYRRLASCAFVDVLTKSKSNKKRRISKAQRENLEWVNIDKAKSIELVGDAETLAQVHPRMLCEAMWETATKLTYCELVTGKVNCVEHANGKLKGAKLEDGRMIEGDALLVSAGPWSADIVSGSKANSVLFDTKSVGKQVVFFTDESQNNYEGFVRPDQTMFCSGFCEDEVRVTEDPGEEKPTEEIVDKIIRGIRGAAASDYIVKENKVRACYQPTTPDGLPMMGSVPDIPRCYIAVGHDCWGILMGPATGEVMSNLIMTGKTNQGDVNLRPFDPSRFGSIELFSRK